MTILPVLVDGVKVPRFLYGTAWKEDRTQSLTLLAIKEGFWGIDTANQRRHYDEAGVGAAISAAIESHLVARDDLFLQSKFTFRRGQDHRLPYDAHAPISDQVKQSFAVTLDHLRTEAIDSFLLHGPTQRTGLTADDWAAWKAMEAIHDSGKVRFLGVSNFTLEQLQSLCHQARVPPRFVQNRCYAALGWDHRVREFCGTNGILYQGFSLLTANPEALASAELAQISKRHGRTGGQIVFRFAIDMGMIPLTGTTNVDHMRMDLDVLDFQLNPDEIEQIAHIYER